jgi:hypothetical protein
MIHQNSTRCSEVEFIKSSEKVAEKSPFQKGLERYFFTTGEQLLANLACAVGFIEKSALLPFQRQIVQE